LAKLKIITETGMFHVACRCESGGRVEWYGFKPVKHRTPVSPGYVDNSDRSALEKHHITFEVPDSQLSFSVAAAKKLYEGETYILAVKDCVSFGADIARGVGLGVPAVNLTPYGFIQTLALWNKYVDRS
jgi:hypothetical protein